MKKQMFSFALSALFLCLLLQTGFAQSIQIGVRAGILLNNVTIDPDDEDVSPKMLLAPQVAIPIEIGIGDMFAVQPEIMYGSHGFKLDESSTTTEGNVTVRSSAEGKLKANTLEIPLLAKVKFGSETLKFHALAGPSFGFGLSGKFESKGSVVATDDTGTVLFEASFDDEGDLKFVGNDYDETDLGDDATPFAKTNLNLHLGAGVNFMMGSATLFFDARYILGLSDLSPKAQGETDDEHVKIKGNRISVSVGVLFPIGG